MPVGGWMMDDGSGYGANVKRRQPVSDQGRGRQWWTETSSTTHSRSPIGRQDCILLEAVPLLTE